MMQWLLADLHIHSTFSDGSVQIETPREDDSSSSGSAQAGSEKILIVDDERDLVDLVDYNLKGKGYQTLRAYNGFEAWEKIQSQRPEVMILDLMMPELDGWELCRIIRRHDNEAIRGISILMLSARVMPEDRVHGLEVGADDYLTKPFSVNELILRVEKLMEKRKIMGHLRGEMELLRSATQEKEASLRKVVHDLKNPLISVGASAKRMLRKNQTDEDLRILRIIYDNSIRLTRWVDGALLPAGLSSQKIKEEMKDVLIKNAEPEGLVGYTSVVFREWAKDCPYSWSTLDLFRSGEHVRMAREK